MRTDITDEKIIKGGDVKLNKSELARQYVLISNLYSPKNNLNFKIINDNLFDLV